MKIVTKKSAIAHRTKRLVSVGAGWSGAVALIVTTSLG